jgi:protein gp37
MSRMFRTVTKTWNVFSGCRFSCDYCWSRPLIEGRLAHLPKYKAGFEPTFHPEELKKKFKPGEFVGVALMGDISFAAPAQLDEVFDVIARFPKTNFLLQTKDPSLFSRLPACELPKLNVYYGSTLETNRVYDCSMAPSPATRFVSLYQLSAPHKFVSVEPIMDFDLGGFVHWLEELKPDIVELGYDNYGHRLVEPKLAKTLELIEMLEQFTIVRRKAIRKAWNE